MSTIVEEDIQHVRQQTNIVDIIGEHVTLKKSGRTFRGLCPFHNEKSPSFHIDHAKQLYHCFGCGVGGDVITFLMKHEGLDFREAIEYLARKIGYTLNLEKSGNSGMRSGLLKACEEATCFYQRQLAGKAGTAARKYLAERKLEDLSEKFRLGFSPDWDSLIKFLKTKKLDGQMIGAGLAVRSERGRVYDRFRGRLIFPITDNQGRPIAFGGRVLDDSMPKYLNSPETPLFHKGSVLYGLHQAKNDLIRTDTAIIVEGYTDLLALAKHGITNTVATLGTAFTADHLKFLSRFVKKIVLVFDGDEAGLKAAERSSGYLDLARLPGHEVFNELVDKVETEILVAVLPISYDPASLIMKEGRESFQARVSGASPLINFLIDRIIQRHGAKKSGRVISAKEATRLISSLPSAVAQEEYMRYLADKLDLTYETITQEIFQSKRKLKDAGDEKKSDRSSAEREFLKLILQYPEKADAIEKVCIEEWAESDLKELGIFIKSMTGSERKTITDSLHGIDSSLQGLLSKLMIESLPVNDIEKYFRDIVLKLKELSLDHQIKLLRKELKEIKNEDKQSDQIFEKLLKLEHKRRELKEYAKDGGDS